MARRLARLLQRLRDEECGQSLVVIVSSLTVLLGMAALGIDAASWMVKHHRAQVVADAAALAAAQCLANPGHASTIVLNGVQTTVPACTSATDVSDAQTVAVDYAAANGLSISASDVSVDTSTDTVHVTAPSTSKSVFASLFGLRQTTQTAASGASFTTSGSCSDPGAGCDFMFAEDSNCASATNGIYVNASGNTSVGGNIQSNGNLSGATSGNISLGYGSYGPNGTSTCSDSITYNGHNPWSAPPTQASTDIPFPIDYSKDFPPCGGSGEATCQSNGYPRFCTNEGSNITLTGSGSGDVPISGNIYCASGTGDPSDPSTWNGTITISVSGNYTWYDTFVGGTIDYNVSGNEQLSSCGYSVSGYTSSECSSSVPAPATANYPIFYATGSSSTAIDVNISGGQTLNGDLFAPNGTAYLNMSGNKALTTFIESYDINANISGTFLGDGPAAAGGSSAGGSVALVQ